MEHDLRNHDVCKVNIRNMKIGPKYKIGKRLGASVFEKCQTQKFVLSEERSKKRRGSRPRQLSDFGKQLLEKQKVRYTYGVSEKQLSRYVAEAVETKTDPMNKLFQTLEMRLDNVVYRLGIAPTRQFARQMVSHGHIIVGGTRVTVPSYQTSVGEVITVKEGSREKGLFAHLEEYLKNYSTPKWLKFDAKKWEGSITSVPELIAGETAFDLELVLEFYSR